MKIIKKSQNPILNVDVVGTPTINNFVMSNFSSSNYAVLPINGRVNDSEYVVKFQTGNISTEQSILHSEHWLSLCIKSNYLTTWNWASSGYKNIMSISSNTIYWVKVICSGTNRSFYVSTDGSTYTLQLSDIDSTVTGTISQNYPFRFGIFSHETSAPFLGSIYFEDTYIKVNNNTIWQGVIPGLHKYYYIHQNNKYYGINDTLNPPANVIFDEVDNNNYITYKSQDGQSYWRKSYSGLCYGGFCVFEDGGNNWIVAFTISEVQNNCIMYRDSNQNVTLGISSTTLNYKGKNWYYSINNNANRYNNPTSTIIDFNKNNGRYWIGGENKIYTGSDNNEKFIQVAKDFLDYIYSF